MRHVTQITVGTSIVIAVAAAAALLAGYRLNLTSSIPIGLYHITSDSLRPGALVLMCLPDSVAEFARRRGYVHGGGHCAAHTMPIGKAIAAIQGDTVIATSDGMRRNGRLLANSAALARDDRGRPLPQLRPGTYVVGRDTVWVVSEYSPRSFDSRYIGGLPASLVVAQVRSVWTR